MRDKKSWHLVRHHACEIKHRSTAVIWHTVIFVTVVAVGIQLEEFFYLVIFKACYYQFCYLDDFHLLVNRAICLRIQKLFLFCWLFALFHGCCAGTVMLITRDEIVDFWTGIWGLIFSRGVLFFRSSMCFWNFLFRLVLCCALFRRVLLDFQHQEFKRNFSVESRRFDI